MAVSRRRSIRQRKIRTCSPCQHQEQIDLEEWLAIDPDAAREQASFDALPPEVRDVINTLHVEPPSTASVHRSIALVGVERTIQALREHGRR